MPLQDEEAMQQPCTCSASESCSKPAVLASMTLANSITYKLGRYQQLRHVNQQFPVLTGHPQTTSSSGGVVDPSSGQQPYTAIIQPPHQQQQQPCETAAADSSAPAADTPVSCSNQRRKALRKWLVKERTVHVAVLLLAGAKLVHKARQLLATWAQHKKASQAEQQQLGILWLRNDLRLHDHPALTAALQQCKTVIPVYCFDPCEYAVQPYTTTLHSGSEPNAPAGPPRSTAQRAAFVLDSLHDLRARLHSIGSDLLVRQGAPEHVLPALAQRLGVQHVYCHGEVTQEDIQVEGAVQAALRAASSGKAQLHTLTEGCTLFDLDELPGRQDPRSPPDYRAFCTHVMGAAVPPPLPAPTSLGPLPVNPRLRTGTIPTLAQLGYSSTCTKTHHPAGTAASLHSGCIRGGETEALRQLHAFIGQHTHILHPIQPTNTASEHPIADSSECNGSTCTVPEGSSGQVVAGALEHAVTGTLQAISHRSSDGSAVVGNSNSNCSSSAGSAAAAALSCRISPWLAIGCLSPRQLYHTITSSSSSSSSSSSAQTAGVNQASPIVIPPSLLPSNQASQCSSASGRAQAHPSTAHSARPQVGEGPHQWLLCELLWRDFFRLITHKYSQGSSGQVLGAAA